MTTVAFTPSTSSVFQFQATLDGALYTVTTPWSVYRKGFYVNVRDQSANLIVATPLIGSPPPPQNGVNMVAGYFVTSSLSYYPASGTFVVTP